MFQRTDHEYDAADPDSAALRAVHAFLLDDVSSFPLDTEDEDADTDAVLHWSPPPPPPSLSPLSLPSTPIDSHDHATTSDSGGASDTPHISPIKPTMGKASGCPPARPRHINHSRVRLKKEILLLRQQVIALDARYATIQSGQNDAASTTPDTMLVAWKTVALDQRAQREAAESEREKLREVVREYKRGIKRIRRFVKTRVAPPGPYTMPTTSIPTPTQLMDEAETAAGFDDMGRWFKTMYEQLNTVFKDLRVDDFVNGVSDLHVENDMTADMTVKLRESRFLPFDAATTAAALWNFRQARIRSVSTGIKEEAFQAHIATRRTFSATIDFKAYQGVIHGLNETRRFKNGEDHILLHCTRLSWANRQASEPDDAFGFRFFNWTVVRPLPNINGRSVCQVLLFELGMPFRVVPRQDRALSAEATATPPFSRALRDFCVEILTYVQQVECQQIENQLLDRNTTTGCQVQCLKYPATPR